MVRLRDRLRLLLLDLLHVLLEEPLLDVHHVELAPLDVRLINVRRHVERRPRRDEQRALLPDLERADRKSTRLNSSHSQISYAVFCLKKKKHESEHTVAR